jgi:hypothetical protein
MEDSTQSLRKATLAAVLAALVGWLVLVCAYEAAGLSSQFAALVALVAGIVS